MDWMRITYIYIYTYIYVHLCMYIHAYIYIYIWYMQLCVNINIHTCKCIYIYILTWCFISLSKWVVTLVLSGLSVPIPRGMKQGYNLPVDSWDEPFIRMLCLSILQCWWMLMVIHVEPCLCMQGTQMINSYGKNMHQTKSNSSGQLSIIDQK